ncbi:hypothetical protein R3P38DRAFT_2768437 [Favolaschia claudopus]|uniref:F-box/LRR-repeat protein n=1 Tax=Favolaschia claudopus TaxID=2862362 RepID=A0AAW0CM33_9AGAR
MGCISKKDSKLAESNSRELVDRMIDSVAQSTSDNVDLRSCSLVSKNWTQQAQKKQFESISSPNLEAARKLLIMTSASRHILAFIKCLRFQVNSVDIGTGTQELAALSNLLEGLFNLEELDLTVEGCPSGSPVRPDDWQAVQNYALVYTRWHSYVFPLVFAQGLQLSLKNRLQVTKLTLCNWEFEDLQNLVGIIGCTPRFEALILCCCNWKSSVLAPTVVELDLRSIGMLEFSQCGLMFEMLQCFAGPQVEISTLWIESDSHEYLTYILGNKLGLKVKNICLKIDPLHLHIGVLLYDDDSESGEALEDVASLLVSALAIQGSTSELRIGVLSQLKGAVNAVNGLWEKVDEFVRERSCQGVLRVVSRCFNTEEQRLDYVLQLEGVL